MSAENQQNRRVAERYCLDAGVDFFIDADIVGATALDVSISGISFISPEPLIVEMRLNVNGEREERRAKLVRAEQRPDGSVCYGMEFTDEEMPLPPDDF